MKYIDADKLKAEIKDRLHCNGSFDECGDTAWDYDQGMVAAYNYVLSFIDSLQQEQTEVDLENEIEKKRRTILLDVFGLMNGEQCLAIKNFARHFYELGLNAKEK